MAIASKDEFTLDEFLAELDQASESTNSLPVARDLQDEVTGILYEGIAANFANASDAQGSAWPPHAPATVQKYGPHPLLVLSGVMWASSTGSGPDSVIEVDDRELYIGISTPYAAYQQFGTNHIPARPFFEAGEEYWARVDDAVADYFTHEVIG